MTHIERELLEEHYTDTNIKRIRQKLLTIMETMHYKRVGAIDNDGTVLLHPSVKDKAQKFIEDRYRELSETVEYSILPLLSLVDQAMWECLANGAPEGVDFGVWVREVCRLGFKTKESVLNHRI